MAKNGNRQKLLKQNRAKLTAMTGLFVAVALFALIMTGCAGSSSQGNEPRPFEQPPPTDQPGSAARNADLQSALQSYQPSEPDTILPEDARLDDYVRYAMRHHPDLSAAFYRWRAALERIPQARTLPDPKVSLGVVFDQVDRDSEYMGERYTLEQMFPWYGKLALSGDIALTQAHAEAQRFEATRLQLVDQVSRAYFEYAFQYYATMIARDNFELLVRLEAVARTMFSTGATILADVNRAQIEIGRMDDQVRSLEDLVGVSAAELNAASGRPAHARLPAVPDRPSLHKVSELLGYTDEQWLALARQHNPELAEARHTVEQQKQAIALAHKNYYPDITVGVEYARDGSARMAMMDEGGADMLSGMLSINIPIWHKKYDAGVREMQARASEAHQQIKSRENRLEANLKLALFTYRDSLRKLTLYGDTLLPMARQTLATTETAYRAGKAGFSDLINAQRTLLEFALAHERAATDRAQAFTRIQTLVGGRLTESNAALKTTTDGKPQQSSPASQLQ